MNQNDFLKIKELIKSIFNPLQEQLTSTNDKLDKLQKTVDEHTDILNNRILPSVTFIEASIKTYKDMYQYNNVNSKRLEKRIEVLEDIAGVSVPSELTLQEVQ